MFRAAIVLYVLCIFALVASYFAVSAVDVGAAMYLQAPPTLQADAPNAARGIVMDAPTGRLYAHAKTTFRIGSTVVGEAETASHGYLHATLRPPASLAGDQKLSVEVDHPGVEELGAEVPTTINTGPERFVWPAGTTRVTDEKESVLAAWDGGLKVLMIPPDGQIARGLPSVAYLLLVDAETEAPVSGTLTVTKIEGMLEKAIPTTLTTDELGLVKLPVAAATSVRLTITATQGERTGTGTVRLNTVPSQFSIDPHQLLAIPGQPYKANVSTLHRSGGILVDLYDGDRWANADAFGIGPQGAGVQVIVPQDVRGPIVAIQVYQDLFDAGTAWDSRWVAIAPSGSPAECRAAVGTVLALHETHSKLYAKWASHAKSIPALDAQFKIGRCDHWLEAALLAIPHSFVPAPLLMNTQRDDRAELEAWRDGVQRKLMFATAGVLLVGFAYVLLLVLQGLRRREHQSQTMRELELETASADELAQPARIDLERLVLVVQTVIIVLTLFTFGASLLMLLSWM